MLALTLCLVGILTAIGLNSYVATLSSHADELSAAGPFLREGNQLLSLHEDKVPPEANDWLANHQEYGQPFGRYHTSRPNRQTESRSRLYLQPLGDFDDKHNSLIADTAEFLSYYYNLPTEVLPPVELTDVPTSARREQWGRNQLLTHYLLNAVLKPSRPDDAIGVLGLTTDDLWPGEGWNYLFGQANLAERVGIWSLCRYGDPEGSEDEWREYRKRTYKVALHETGHMLGMLHCIYFECLMNGSNHLAEMDSRPFWLCPECVRKVWWNCEADPHTRYKQLAAFADRHALTEESSFWRRSLALINP